MRKLLVGVAALLALAGVLFVWVGGTTGLMARALPDFPELPAPPERLGADAAGVLTFASTTPYDLDVILAGMEHAIPTTGQGTLYLPAQASAASPVPAMVLLHGSGGLSPGREHRVGRWFSEHKANRSDREVNQMYLSC